MSQHRHMLMLGLGLGVIIITGSATEVAQHAKPSESQVQKQDQKPWYDYRTTEAYELLTEEEKAKLTQVHHDFALLWGALDMYADQHGGNPPDSLDQLVPRFLRELPADPFMTNEQHGKEERFYNRSKDGWGYGYRRGAVGNRAWCLSSVGLPGFPFLAERGNVDLYICKGTWISGENPVMMKQSGEQ